MTARFERNADAWPRLAHTPQMHAYLDNLARELAAQIQATAPRASGGYAASITAEVVEDDGYPTARVMAHDPLSIQVEYGTGFSIIGAGGRDRRGRFTAARRGRHQGGSSPAHHPLLRGLLWLEGRQA